LKLFVGKYKLFFDARRMSADHKIGGHFLGLESCVGLCKILKIRESETRKKEGLVRQQPVSEGTGLMRKTGEILPYIPPNNYSKK
jgi:hypothetical protein